MESARTEEYFFADVWLPLSVSGSFTYRLKKEHVGKIKIGARVLVNFGKKKLYAALVVRLHHSPPKQYEAKYIHEILDEFPIVNEKNLAFWEWMSRYYMSCPGEVMRWAIPAGFKIQSDTSYSLNEKMEFDFENTDKIEQTLAEFFKEKKSVTIETLQKHPLYHKIYPVFKAWLRSGFIVANEEWEENYKPKMLAYVRLNPNLPLEKILPSLEKKAFKQAECVLYLLKESKSNNAYEEGWLEKSVLLERFGSAAIRGLLKKNILEELHAPVSRLKTHKAIPKQLSALSEAQQKAYDEIIACFRQGKPALLYGVTGSGKTEIFMHLIQDALKDGKQVLYLLPEIALTLHHIQKLRSCFGNKVGLYHSRFNDKERVEIWQKVLENNMHPNEGYSVILAPRSGIFLPFERLGLVVVDEEHDASYKQHQGQPRYHARDAALYLSKHIYKDCNVVLGSATPSLESIFLSDENLMGKVELKNRYYGNDDTEILIADMNKEYTYPSEPAFMSEMLKKKTEEVLSQNHQVLLFMGRRGYAPYYRCRQCHTVSMCKHCDVPLVYHKSPGHLLCHYCGYAVSVYGKCHRCGSTDMKMEGSGTEKIEEHLKVLFPNHVVERMDLDNTRSRHAFEDILERFEKNKINILIGTHLITKGLDFSNVGLVGILNFDQHLHFPEFRAYERAFQLAVQLQGRAARRGQKGYFIIQTCYPNHPIITSIVNRNEAGCYRSILEQRKNHQYPPYYRLTELDLISEKKDMLEFFSNNFIKHISSIIPNHLSQNIQLLGPEWPLISKIKGKYIRRSLIKFPRNADLNAIYAWFNQIEQEFASAKKHQSIRLAWNPDPY
ncbi:MAG: primosomal protein N' [Bacteroidia bacterium]|nr:primosomal protein N' [Bacteroidia bacterium]